MRRTDFGDGPGVRGDLCVFLSPSGPCAWAPLDPWRYADEGESGSGADGGESVLSNGGRDGGESGMFVALHLTVVASHQVQSLLEALVSARLRRGRARPTL